MRHLRARIAFVLALVALLGSCGGGSGGGGAPGKFGEGTPEVAATPEIEALEKAMHARLNRDRAKKGLGPLAFDAKLAAVGRAHSEDMRVHHFFAHESPQT